jgi:hypothetical protein
MTAKNPFIRVSLPLLVLLILASGCLFSPPTKDPVDDTPVSYLNYSTPDNLIANFITSWEARDVEEYREKILYNSQVSTDGEQYETFTFYFAPPGQNDEYEEGTVYLYDEEVETATSMFSGIPSEHSAGVKSISLGLTKHQTWGNPQSEYDVEGDPYPAGTKRCVYTTDMEVTLKEEIDIGGIPINGFTVDDDLEFHVIPVGDADSPRYMIWKWRDLSQPNDG